MRAPTHRVQEGQGQSKKLQQRKAARTDVVGEAMGTKEQYGYTIGKRENNVGTKGGHALDASEPWKKVILPRPNALAGAVTAHAGAPLLFPTHGGGAPPFWQDENSPGLWWGGPFQSDTFNDLLWAAQTISSNWK